MSAVIDLETWGDGLVIHWIWVIFGGIYCHLTLLLSTKQKCLDVVDRKVYVRFVLVSFMSMQLVARFSRIPAGNQVLGF